MSPLQQKPILHGRDHGCGGADPIPGICDLMGGATYEDAIRNDDLTAWWQLGDTFTFGSSVSDAMIDSADFDVDSPRNLDYVESSSTNRPTLQVAEAVDESDPGAVEFNFTSTAGPYFFSIANEVADVTQFGTTADLAQTVSCWLKVKAGMGAIYGPVLGRWGMDLSGANNVGWVIEVEQSTYVLRFRAKPDISTTYLITGPTLTVDTWYHVAVSWDGTTWTLYVNGGFYDDVTGSSAPADPNGDSPDHGFSVGAAFYDLGAGSQHQPFYGSVDSVAFWRRVLTADEISNIAAGGDTGGLTEAVESIAKAGDTALTGDVTLSEGSNVTLTQVGQDIEIAASGGSGILESLLDAKGDLIAASAADTAARLAVGTNGHVLTADSAQSTGIKWAAVASGGITEVAYAEFTSNATISATVEASANTVVSAGAATYTAVRHKIEFWCPQAQMFATAAGTLIINLWDASTNIARIGYYEFSVQHSAPIYLCRFLTPTAASHTYIVKAWASGTGASGSIKAGAGTGGSGSTLMPGFIRVTYGG